MKNNSTPEMTKKKEKTGYKKTTTSRRTLNDVNEFFRVMPDDDIFTSEVAKKNEKKTDPKRINKNKIYLNLNSVLGIVPDDSVPISKITKKNERENLNKTIFQKKIYITESFQTVNHEKDNLYKSNSQKKRDISESFQTMNHEKDNLYKINFHKKRDVTECFQTTNHVKDNLHKSNFHKKTEGTIIPDKKVKEAATVSKAIKDDIKQNHNKQVSNEVVDKENLRKYNRSVREEDIHRSDVRKKFKSLIRENAKGNLIKNNSKLVGDVTVNISKPIEDILKTNYRKFNRDLIDSKNRGEGDIGTQNKSIKPNENKKTDDKRLNNVVKEVPIIKPYLDIISKKQINDRYSIKMKNGGLLKDTAGKVAKEINSDVVKKIDKAMPKSKSGNVSDKSIHTEPKSVETRSVKKPMKNNSNGQRKPIIKTVTVKNDNRVYKAVTFVDRKQPTPLFINMPRNYKKPPKKDHDPKYTSKHNISNDSFVKEPKTVHEKIAKVKKRGKRRRILSPELFTKGPSPPTEVAKWAPSCLTHHTKPYYEAWVDTTLAATTKRLKNDEFSLHRQRFVKAFKTALEKPMTTSDEGVYEKIGDERYTGTIRVRHR